MDHDIFESPPLFDSVALDVVLPPSGVPQKLDMEPDSRKTDMDSIVCVCVGVCVCVCVCERERERERDREGERERERERDGKTDRCNSFQFLTPLIFFWGGEKADRQTGKQT